MATNAGGLRVLRFGPMRAQLRGIEAVLADGTVVASLGGSISAEHGIGALKARWLALARTGDGHEDEAVGQGADGDLLATIQLPS